MTTEILRDLVGEYFSGQEWSLTFEVGNGTGFSVRRHADAVAMNLWPSRGLSLHGIEMKISRGDWQRELSDPAKAEEIHQHCDYWWLAAAHGVVKDIEEIPPGWGFLEMSKIEIASSDKRPRLRLRRQASRSDRDGRVDRGFVAAILRAHSRADSQVRQRAVEDRVEAIVNSRVEAALKSRQNEHDGTTKRLQKLMETCAQVDAEQYLSDDDFCRAVAFVLRSGVTASYGGINGLIAQFEAAETQAKRAGDALRAAAEATGIPAKDEGRQAALPLRKRA